MLKQAEQIKHMSVLESTYSGCVMCYTFDTSNALNRTLAELLSLIKLFLNHGFSYLLPGIFQSDRLEKEFDIYRQSSGGCYYTSNMLLCYLVKLYDKLNFELSLSHIQQVVVP